MNGSIGHTRTNCPQILVPAYAWSSELPVGKFDPAQALGGIG
jgi:hypothetical protein